MDVSIKVSMDNQEMEFIAANLSLDARTSFVAQKINRMLQEAYLLGRKHGANDDISPAVKE